MSFVIEAPTPPSVPVVGGGRFPLRRIICVGQNYAAHVREMGSDTRQPPFFFAKPADAVVPAGAGEGAVAPYPPGTENLHYEIELAVAVGTGGRRIAPEAALSHLWGAGVAVDLTRRDLQAAAKEAGKPWDMAKGFDASAPIAPLLPMAEAPGVETGRIWLSVNGEMRQEADLAEMIWPVRDIVARLSEAIALAPGDLILTGTPAGVGALVPGDVVRGGVAGYPELEVTIGDPL